MGLRQSLGTWIPQSIKKVLVQQPQNSLDASVFGLQIPIYAHTRALVHAHKVIKVEHLITPTPD